MGAGVRKAVVMQVFAGLALCSSSAATALSFARGNTLLGIIYAVLALFWAWRFWHWSQVSV